jgi:drug/metabolite transporter (DMT)-like permease
MELYIERMLNSVIVLISEIALALYPILIKRVPTDLLTQTVSRLFTFSIAAFALASPSDIATTWGTPSGIFRSLSLGLITLAHVGLSYTAFAELPAGVAMSLFYTYPILNLIGGLFTVESISTSQWLLALLAFVGVVLVSQSITEGEDQTKKQTTLKGIFAALGAALTETIMYFAVRTAKQPNPYFATLELYPGSLIPLLGYILYKGVPIDWNPSAWIPMTLFNLFVGFVGYALRFYAIPRVSVGVFSILTFVGVIASFLWGYLFAEEIPNWLTLLGATLIASSVGLSNAPQ